MKRRQHKQDNLHLNYLFIITFGLTILYAFSLIPAGGGVTGFLTASDQSKCDKYFGDLTCDDTAVKCGSHYKSGKSLDACGECDALKDGKKGFDCSTPATGPESLVCKSYFDDTICDDSKTDCGADYSGLSAEHCNECQTGGFGCSGSSSDDKVSLEKNPIIVFTRVDHKGIPIKITESVPVLKKLVENYERNDDLFRIDDIARSIVIPSSIKEKYVVTLYQDENFKDGCSAIFESRNNFGDVKPHRKFLPDSPIWDIDSIKVSKFDGVLLFKDVDFKGAAAHISTDTNSFGSECVQFEISSIKLAPGYKAILYDDVDFKGNSLTVQESISDLKNVNFNDKPKSIKIIPPNSPINLPKTSEPVTDKLSPPIFLQCKVVSTDAVHLDWVSLDGKSYRAEWCKDGLNFNEVYSSNDPSECFFSISEQPDMWALGLQSDTVYNFRVRAEHPSIESSEWSKTIQCKTKFVSRPDLSIEKVTLSNGQEITPETSIFENSLIRVHVKLTGADISSESPYKSYKVELQHLDNEIAQDQIKTGITKVVIGTVLTLVSKDKNIKTVGTVFSTIGALEASEAIFSDKVKDLHIVNSKIITAHKKDSVLTVDLNANIQKGKRKLNIVINPFNKISEDSYNVLPETDFKNNFWRDKYNLFEII